MTTPPIPSPTSHQPAPMRRLNKRPLYAGVALGLLVVVGISYSVYKRMQGPDFAAKPAAKTTPSAADGSALSNSITRGARADPPPAEKDKPTPGPDTNDKKGSPPPETTADGGGHSLYEDARAAAWKEFFARSAQVANTRYEAARKALAEDTELSTKEGSALSPPTTGTGGSTQAVAVAGSSALSQPPYGSGGLDLPGGGGSDARAQGEKQAFANQTGDPLGQNEDLVAFKHGAKPNTIMQGTPINAVTVIGSTSDMPGMVKAMVTETVFDGMTGKVTLIPQGSFLVGKSDNAVSNGQTREGVIWTRVEFPDTSSLQLGAMPGSDLAGYAGEHDLVDTHWVEKFLAATVISIGGAAAQLAQPQQSAFSGYSPSSVAAGSLTQQYSQLGQAYAQAGLSVPNTLIIRPGYPISVLVNKDVRLPPYVDQRGMQSVSMGPVFR